MSVSRTTQTVRDAVNSLSPQEKDLILEDLLRCMYDRRLLDSVDGWPPPDPFYPPHPPMWFSLHPLESYGFWEPS